MSSENGNVLYVGVTSNLRGRVWEHRTKHYPGSFTARYNCIKLLYYEVFDNMTIAIDEEKRIKAGNRIKKEKLIDRINKERRDLWTEIQEW